MLDETFSLENHPMILVVCGIYHYEKKGGEPTAETLFELLKPLITKDELKKQLDQMICFGVINENFRSAGETNVMRTFAIGGYTREMARDTYERYWLEIEMQKRQGGD